MRKKKQILSTSLALAVAMTLTGCGGPDGAEPIVEESPMVENGVEEGLDTEADDAEEAAPEVDEVTAAALAAIDLAESDTGGVAYELDDEDDRSAWQIDVSVGGDDVEVLVDWAGASILSSGADGAVDADDLDKLSTATLSIQEAIVIAAGEVNGHVIGVDLTTEGGAVAWEVEFDDGGTDWEVYVDAQSGEVLKIEED